MKRVLSLVVAARRVSSASRDLSWPFLRWSCALLLRFVHIDTDSQQAHPLQRRRAGDHVAATAYGAQTVQNAEASAARTNIPGFTGKSAELPPVRAPAEQRPVGQPAQEPAALGVQPGENRVSEGPQARPAEPAPAAPDDSAPAVTIKNTS